ncbi:MAG: FAD-dependent monooxygenase [Acidimicrobiales bacterium]|nr:FAD-dependent monooxygenase [Acidimicrobiales bacterium]MBO0886150.1 FAD-dependent monooxygenase [Acidimicrobiales bacterium]MBO0893361.1 FAD-dependent monooxygenase [Acidimicrobiales bacterium]
MDEPAIAIIGAGIGGLTLAACLLQMHLPVTVFEQATEFRRVGTGIQLAPNAMKVLSPLGLRPRLEGLAFCPATMANREWDSGELTFELPLGERAELDYGAPYFLLHRGDLHQALLDRVPKDVIRLRSRLVGIEGRGERIGLRFADGSHAEADVVVGADGVHSVVRDQIHVASASFTGRVAYRAVFDRELVRGPAPGPSTKWWGPDRHIVIYYVSAGREVYFTTSVPDEAWTVESWSARGSTTELRDAFAGFHEEVTGVLEACPSVHKWAIYDRDALPRWHTGNVVLLGDACHPMTPYMAQGGATAMEDAVVLARCMAAAGSGDLSAAFSRYETCRKPRTSAIQSGSRSNTWLREPTDPGWVYDYDAWRVPLEAPPLPLGRPQAGSSGG